jgi:hypothetical protein
MPAGALTAVEPIDYDETFAATTSADVDNIAFREAVAEQDHFLELYLRLRVARTIGLVDLAQALTVFQQVEVPGCGRRTTDDVRIEQHTEGHERSAFSLFIRGAQEYVERAWRWTSSARILWHHPPLAQRGETVASNSGQVANRPGSDLMRKESSRQFRTANLAGHGIVQETSVQEVTPENADTGGSPGFQVRCFAPNAAKPNPNIHEARRIMPISSQKLGSVDA